MLQADIRGKRAGVGNGIRCACQQVRKLNRSPNRPREDANREIEGPGYPAQEVGRDVAAIVQRSHGGSAADEAMVCFGPTLVNDRNRAATRPKGGVPCPPLPPKKTSLG